ncbi:MAG: hypothetical protein VW728_05585 [Paracoccaceae bacterium]
MNNRSTPTYLPRKSYRARRLVDAAKLMPYLAVLLWMLPMLWQGEDANLRVSRIILYIFGVWFFLIATQIVINFFLNRVSKEVDWPLEHQDKNQGDVG